MPENCLRSKIRCQKKFKIFFYFLLLNRLKEPLDTCSMLVKAQTLTQKACKLVPPLLKRIWQTQKNPTNAFKLVYNGKLASVDLPTCLFSNRDRMTPPPNQPVCSSVLSSRSPWPKSGTKGIQTGATDDKNHRTVIKVTY